MPKKISQLRIAFDDTYDIIHKIEHHDGEYYIIRRTIIYTPRDDCKSKIRVI